MRSCVCFTTVITCSSEMYLFANKFAINLQKLEATINKSEEKVRAERAEGLGVAKSADAK